ncbi:MAG: exo-alpha-sialidase [Phycisphaerales bacterium]|nr:MAG: exo-alpha-sialidase [Phycisphaerales bacterium]
MRPSSMRRNVFVSVPPAVDRRRTVFIVTLTAFFLAVSRSAPAEDPTRQFGSAWTDPAPLNNNADTDSGDDCAPHVSTDAGGTWVAVWWSSENLGGTIGTDGDILVARSVDNGVTWTDPEPLNNNAATDSGDDWSAQAATDGAGNWVAVWDSIDTLSGTIGTDHDILVARSTDNGVTWTDPAPLNNNAETDSGNDWYAQVTTDGAGNWVAVWWSTGMFGTDYDILVSRSTDDGATWTDPAPLNNDAAADSRQDKQPQVTTDRAGNWVAVWFFMDSLGGPFGSDYDILVARSTDDGATWTDPAPLNSGAATDSGNDLSPQVTTDAGGNWVAAWHSSENLAGTIGSDYDILVARSTDNGATWTDPVPLNNNAATDLGHDGYPEVATDAAGIWLAVWRSHDDLGATIGTDGDILVACSNDNGLTWTDPEPLNNNAATDSENDWYPQITTDGAGNWVTVWDSTDNLSGTIGTDYDILVAQTSVVPGDCDRDGKVDLYDFALFCQCFAGTGNPPAVGCQPGVDADLDNDGDVDLGDFTLFAANCTGPL